jgi:hypothetical protein
MIHTANECGSCTMCCKLMGVTELKKPTNVWCTHCDIGKGCKIYPDRPTSCREFECLYKMMPKADIALRPDKCKVVIAPTTNPDVFSVHVDNTTPGAWKKEPIYTYLKGLAEGGWTVVISTGEHTLEKIVLKRQGPGLVSTQHVKMTPPDEKGMQWYVPAVKSPC